MSEPTGTSDEDIARLVQRGDTEAFGVLVERYEPKMRRYARRFLFGYDDAKDVVQDVFLRAYVAINSFDASARFSPWLYRIAHNLFINTIKKRGKEPLPLLDFDGFFPHLGSPPTPHDELEEAETRAALETKLGALDPKYREPLVLYYYEGLSYDQIADVLHLPQSTVGVRINRAKQQLKRTITP